MVKILGIDDNSEAFSLLVTLVFGVFLFIGTMALYMKVMGDKNRQDEVRNYYYKLSSIHLTFVSESNSTA